MRTEVLRGNRPAALRQAVELLRAGELVAFATETVYGLGADARSADAVARIFAAKGRPATNPVIVHVHDAAQARTVTSAWDDRAEALAAALWPGPLTLVLPRGPDIPPIVTAGGDTVAVRAPAHLVARALLAHFGGPIAAPSANRSNGISPTTAEHVLAGLDGRIPLVLDGGPCLVGLESTVLDLCGPAPRVLRLGAVGPDRIAAVLGAEVAVEGGTDSGPARSPGRLARHYSPATPLELVEDASDQDLGDAAVLARRRLEGCLQLEILPDDPEGYGRLLYAALHRADAAGARRIVVETVPADTAWAAIRDRLARAAARG